MKVVTTEQMTRRAALSLLSGASLVILAGCGGFVTASYRVRMTVEVATAQGIKTGSSVMEVRASRGMAIGDSSGVSAVLHGEAVVVDLPDGPIFVLLKLPDAGPSLCGVIGEALLGQPIDTPDAVMSSTAKLGSTWLGSYKADLPRRRDIGASLREDGRDDSNWPVMIRFRDIHVPASAELVNPDEIGVKSIVVETTHAIVTRGIGNRIPWLNSNKPFTEAERDPATGYVVPHRHSTIINMIDPWDFTRK